MARARLRLQTLDAYQECGREFRARRDDGRRRLYHGRKRVGAVYREPGVHLRKEHAIVHVQLDDELDAHCARARAAGATIVREPNDEFYGDRVYSARDLEGHVWTFAQTVRTVSRAEAEAASGLTIDAPAWK